jgi:serine protease
VLSIYLVVIGPAAAWGSSLSSESQKTQFIVKHKDSKQPAARKLSGVRGDVGKTFSGSGRRYELIDVNSGSDPAAVKSELENKPDVEYVEVNQRACALAVPNDPLFGRQWNFKQVRAEKAWNITRWPGQGVIVAVLDTGVAYENRTEGGVTYKKIPDFAGTTFVPGYDFVNDDSHPNDDEGHGTHVAGVIAQTTGNGYGTAGLAYSASIMPVKVLDRDGWGTAFDVARAIRWAADHGARVINLSLGIDGFSRTIEDAVNYARNTKKVTVVAAAGNSAIDGNGYLNSDYSGGLTYPARSSRVIGVGATGYDKRRAAYSQYGKGLDLLAPGGTDLDQNGDGNIDGILQQTISRKDPSRYKFYMLTGTSVAAPHVSAAAAMLIARGLDKPGYVYSALTRSAVDLGPRGYDKYSGYGLLDLYGALTYKCVSTEWYFAEGCTENGYDTKITVANPSDMATKIKATF